MSTSTLIPQSQDNPFVILPNEQPDVFADGLSRADRGLVGESPLIPTIPLADGQQYRFHFDMSKCVGCKCCEVACSEQNNNPPEISWRRVGEVEGGTFPNTQRLHLSMGCNHCLDPACMNGCPTRAYTKDEKTGIVLHNSDVCIGCEYCIWNCPYSVPQFNEERGVVGKCDMCYGRLADGDKPACVNACPAEAIKIEIVDIAEWRKEYAEANVPGMPSASDTISTTRITPPANMPLDTEKADYHRVRTEKPHWSLVAVTVLTQLSAGGVGAAWLLQLLGGEEARLAATVALVLGLISLQAAPLHLGRPAFAPLAMRNWRTSWLSREILGLSAFGGAASAYAASLWFDIPGSALLGAAALLLGIGGVYASSRIYLVPGRPAWNMGHTVAEFFLTGAILGPLLLAAMGASSPALTACAAAAGIAQLLNQAWKFVRLTRSEEFERQASARLLSNELSKLFLLRQAFTALGAVALAVAGYPAAGFVAAFAGEVLGRYLFFVSVVPKNMAMSFFGQHQEAA
ncbi:MAG: dimethyl sulfoxide reductase anchor subunit [Bryobacterales bacterium]|nr:dimethyl sulfoxide reductase anchor subunit [Bryobacterales bacterium]